MRILTAAFSVFVALVLFLVGGRFFALLLGAGRDSALVSWIYDHSLFWVKPFFDAFDLSNQGAPGGGRFEPASLIAFLVYAVAGALILALLNSIRFGGFRHHYA